MNNISKKISMLILALLFISAAAFADEVKIVSNPHCGECKVKIENGLNGMSGIENAEVDLNSKIVTVNFNPEVTGKQDIIKQIQSLGYTAELYNGESTKMQNGKHKKCHSKKESGCCKSKKK